MEEWKSIRLGDIVRIGSGLAYKADHLGSGDALLLGMGCVSFNEKFLKKGARLYSGTSEERYIVSPGDIVLATRQQSDNLPILGMPAIIPEDYQGKRLIAGSNLYIVHNQSDIDNRFLYWLLKTPGYINHISSCKTGTTVRMITKKDVESFVFKCPPKEERERIADFLWSIEDKIDLNNRINHNLEEQARSLYKSWFVDFEPFKDGKFVDSELGMIPEGWHIGTLSEIADIAMGQSPSGSSFNEDGHGIVFYQGRTEFGFRFPSIKLFTTEPTRFAEPHSVLMSVRAPVGDINVALDRCCIGRGLAAITAKDEAFSFVLYTLKGKSSELDLYNGEGTVFGSINRKDLEGLSVLIPPMSIIQQFNDCIRPIDESIEIACKEIVNLSFSRDSLLPRLMSGQLSFDECDC